MITYMNRSYNISNHIGRIKKIYDALKDVVANITTTGVFKDIMS
jgi:hypothetical protein